MQMLKRPNQKMHDNAPLVEPMITDTSQSNEVFRDIIFPTFIDRVVGKSIGIRLMVNAC